MPDATEGDLPYRIVVDESSFDFRGVPDCELEDLLEDFSDELESLLRERDVATSPWWSEAECADDLELWQFLYEGRDTDVSPDTRRRAALHLDRCRTWDDELDGIPDEVAVDGKPRQMALSVGYSLRNHLRGHAIACLVFPVTSRTGWLTVTSAWGEGEIYFLTEAARLTDFWRGLFAREEVCEADFFVRARDAFPKLVFADSLTFRKFDGTYRDMREWVVQVLSVVHDHFPDALSAHAGQPYAVQAALGQFGLDLSPESPNTRSKPKIIKQREVEHGGEAYHCEWHAKKERHRNRVHFTVPEPRLGDRILVGIFVDHLDT